MTFQYQQTLKYDAFGRIEKGFFITEQGEALLAIKREYTKNFLLRPLAKFLARNETNAIRKLAVLKDAAFPQLLAVTADYHVRSYIQGDSMHKCVEKLSPSYFSQAKKLLRRMRKAGVCNNDLAKEANWIVNEEGRPAITDFQLALCFRKKRTFWLSLCREDVRHLLKHQRKYGQLTTREKAILSKKSLIGRIWMLTGKKIHWFITRKILGWKERNGPEERHI